MLIEIAIMIYLNLSQSPHNSGFSNEEEIIYIENDEEESKSRNY